MSFLMLNARAQYLYNQIIPFENNVNLIYIDTAQTDNIWQIGTPSKTIFNEAYSVPFAILTDSANNYPLNNTSSFEVKIYSPPQSVWGTGVLSFKHKYDFEPNKDGGYIEVKYDADTIWTNIISDQDPYEEGFGFVSSNNFYSLTDTIVGNIPAFTGTSNTWVESQFYWMWMIGVKGYEHDSITIRFTIQSDENETNQEGWMIDNIRLELISPSSVSSFSSSRKMATVYPNPVVGVSNLEIFDKLDNTSELLIFNSLGVQLLRTQIYTNKTLIKNADYLPGVYFYQVRKNNLTISTGKFSVVE